MKKIILIFLFISSFCLSKDIYIGDKINLNIAGSNIEEVEEATKNFYVDEIKENKNGINISIRSFNVGDNILKIENTKGVLKVKSSIDENDKNIYLDLEDKSNKNLSKNKFPKLVYLSLILFIIGIYIAISEYIRIKKIVTEEDRFMKTMNNLSDDNFIFEVSAGIRRYIDYAYNLKFTSGNYSKFKVINDEDILFIENLDYYKFSGKKIDDKNYYKNKGIEIYSKVVEDIKKKEGEKQDV